MSKRFVWITLGLLCIVIAFTPLRAVATKVSALTETSVLDLADYAYSVVATGPTSARITWTRVGGLLYPTLTTGCLTTVTNNAHPTSDQTSVGTLYFTNCTNDGTVTTNNFQITIYDGTRNRLYDSAQISLAVTATSGKVYDIFIYDNSGTLTLEYSAAWTSDLVRANNLVGQSGNVVKTGATTRRWIGVFEANGTNLTEDSLANRLVANAYNQVSKPLYTCPGYNNNNANTSYTSTSTTFTAANSGTNATASYVLAETDMAFGGYAGVTEGNNIATYVGLGHDSTTTASITGVAFVNVLADASMSGERGFYDAPGLHTLVLLIHVSSGTGTFFADLGRAGSSADVCSSYVHGQVWQ